MRVRIIQEGINELAKSQGVAEQLGDEASKVASRVRAPEGMTITTRHGVGRRGAFAQVSMTGPWAIAVEFGSRRAPPQSPLRNAMRGGR